LNKSYYLERELDEEKWNYITHGIGAILMLFYVMNTQVFHGKAIPLFLGITFLISTMYHSCLNIKMKQRFRQIDMSSIYLSIGVTASIFCYTVGSPAWYLPVFCGLLLSILGYFAYGLFWDSIMVSVSTLFACSSILLFFISSYGSGSTDVALYFYSGNIAYSAGLWFYVRDRKKWFHTIWHVFVVLGAIIHSSYYFTP